MNIYQHIQTDRQSIQGVFQKLERTTEKAEEQRTRLFGELRQRLLSHLRAKDFCLYHHMEKKLRSDDLVIFMREEQSVIEAMLEPLEHIPVRTVEWIARVIILREMVERHFRREEKHLIPLAKRIFTARQAVEMRVEMKQSERDLRTSIAA